MEIKAIIRFSSAYEYAAFLDMPDHFMRIENFCPDLRTLEVVFEDWDDKFLDLVYGGCDDE